MRTSLVRLFSLSMCLVAMEGSAAILNPDVIVAGRTQAQWADAWWQWALSFPANQSPQVDTTGALSFLGNQGPVFFLAGSFTFSSPFVRSTTVREDQFLFMPLITSATWEAISAYGGSESGLRRDNEETIGIMPNGEAPGTTLFARLNGSDLPLPPPTTTLFDFRQRSPGFFDITIPPDNPIVVPPGTVQSLSDGWWLMLSPLEPGNYTIHIGGTTTGIGAYSSTFSPDITYRLTVEAVPEASTILLLGSGLITVFGYRLRKPKVRQN